MNRHETALHILKEGTVIPAIPLVLDSNRSFSKEGQRRLVRYYLEAGAGGVAAAVHTTQFEIRNPDINLFYDVLQTVAEEINRYEEESILSSTDKTSTHMESIGKTLVRIAGACGETKQAVKEAELAKSLGYDAILLSPGGLSGFSDDYLIERTKAVADVLPVIGFYLQTACGGRYLSYDYWKSVSDIDNVVAIKCASFNRYQTIDLIRGVAASKRSDEIALYTGNDDNIVIDLLTPYRFTINGSEIEKRFVGGLLGHWSLWTNTVVKQFEVIKKYRNATQIPIELLTLAAQITDANGAFFDVIHNFSGCIPGVHQVLYKQGLMEGILCLDENEVLSYNQAEEIMRVHAMYPQLNDDLFVKKFLENYKAN